MFFFFRILRFTFILYIFLRGISFTLQKSALFTILYMIPCIWNITMIRMANFFSEKYVKLYILKIAL